MSLHQKIIEYLGGNKFLAMTGAKNLIHSDKEKFIQFDLPRGLRKGVNKVRISLSTGDTYDMIFWKYNPRKLELTPIDEVDNVSADQLRNVLAQKTGLDMYL